MRKIYSTPSVEKIEFDYNNQVVASGGDKGCYYIYNNYDPASGGSCVVDPIHSKTYVV